MLPNLSGSYSIDLTLSTASGWFWLLYSNVGLIQLNALKVTNRQNQSQKPTIIQKNNATNSFPSVLNVVDCQNVWNF